MALKIFIKQAIAYNIIGQPIIYNGANPQVLQPVVNGTLAPSRQWDNYGKYIDVTEYVSDLTELKLTWTAEVKNNGVSVPGQFKNTRSASGTLTFETYAYQLIKKWLVNDVSAPLNAVSVKIQDTSCKGIYEDYQIKAIDLRWCEEGDTNNLCVFDVTVKQNEEPSACIERTLVADNWQGWFDPATTHKHPRFSYCNEQRPNGMMVMVWFITANIMGPTLLFMIPLVIALNGIFAIINVIVGVINTIVNIVGGKPIKDVNWQAIPYIDPKGLLNIMANYFIESAGCGREHPAPLIRDYILNACQKCGVKVDEVTAPIFFARYMPIQPSSKAPYVSENLYYNACYLNAPVKRGVRRFDTLSILASPNLWQFYIPENKPLDTLSEFLDRIKGVYNAEWRVVNNTLYFQRKDYFLDGSYLLDFAANGADRQKLLEGICFEWDSIKYPIYCEGLYALDAADTCGNEALSQMNDIVNFDPTGVNPMFEGKLIKTVQLGGTKFRLDGASVDYIYDAFQITVNSSFLVPFVAGFMFDVVGGAIRTYADYALLMSDETCTLPKILIWDGGSYTNAKAVRPFTAYPVVPTYPPMPVMNFKYNNIPWYQKHPPETKVRGSNLTLPPNQPGYYLVTDFFGVREIKQPAMLVNYFMYFNAGYADTLWDWFHWIDDPVHNPNLHQLWTAKIELCCDSLNALGVFGGQSIALNRKVKLPLQWFPDGRITEVEVNYTTTDTIGQHIILKGIV